MDIKLSDCQVGDKGIILKIKAEKRFRDKLLAMGVLKGTEFKVVRKAPMGDPIELNLRGFNLSLRKDEIESITVKKGIR